MAYFKKFNYIFLNALSFLYLILLKIIHRSNFIKFSFHTKENITTKKLISIVNPKLLYSAYTRGLKKLLIALPNLGILIHIPNAKLTPLPLNHYDIIAT